MMQLEERCEAGGTLPRHVPARQFVLTQQHLEVCADARKVGGLSRMITAPLGPGKPRRC
jgi:hypothetical protein